MTMAARVIYGMARQGDLPGFAGRVHPKTATPLFATALIVAATLALALLVPFERLAEGTSLATLVVFALVNLSLLRLRHRRVHTRRPACARAALGAGGGTRHLSRDDGDGNFRVMQTGCGRLRSSPNACRLKPQHCAPSPPE